MSAVSYPLCRICGNEMGPHCGIACGWMKCLPCNVVFSPRHNRFINMRRLG